MRELIRDVSGKTLTIGDTVAFCMAGTASTMRTGKIIRFTKKQVEIEHAPFGYYDTTITKRNFDCVALI